jgi:protein TonB
MTMATILPADEERALCRWMFAAATVAAVHAGIAFWLMFIRDPGSAGTPPAVIMIELAPVDSAPPSDAPPEPTRGPQMTQADPEKAEPPQTMAVRELPPESKPAVVLMSPPKPKPKPKKIGMETPKPVVRRTHEPPAPHTSAPRAAAAASATASSRAASAAEAAAWRGAWSAAMNWNRHYPEAARTRGEQGTVRLALTIDRGGHVVSARLIGSSGSPILDQAALEMARNASGRPLPPEMGSSVNLTVPVRYSIR